MFTSTTLPRKRSSVFETRVEAGPSGGRHPGGWPSIACRRVARRQATGRASHRVAYDFKHEGSSAIEVIQDEPAACISSGNRACVTIDSQDGGRYFRAGLAHDETPGLLTLRRFSRDVPYAADLRDTFGRRLCGTVGLGFERTNAVALAAVSAAQYAVFERRFQPCRIVIEVEAKVFRSKLPAVEVTRSSPLKNAPAILSPEPENSIRKGIFRSSKAISPCQRPLTDSACADVASCLLFICRS